MNHPSAAEEAQARKFCELFELNPDEPHWNVVTPETTLPKPEHWPRWRIVAWNLRTHRKMLNWMGDFCFSSAAAYREK